MSRFIVLSLGVLIGLLILLTAAAAPAMDRNGAELEPESFEVSGKTCIFFRGQLDCFCPCESGQCGAANVITIPETQVITVPQPIMVTVVETVPVPVHISPAVGEVVVPVGSTEPAGDETAAPVRWDTLLPPGVDGPTPGSDWTSVNMPVLEPGQTENPGADDNPGNGNGPDPDKQFCNQGVGNGTEDCDPGNSNHNQVSNDESPGAEPGAPGRAHNDNGGGNSGGNSSNNGRGNDD